MLVRDQVLKSLEVGPRRTSASESRSKRASFLTAGPDLYPLLNEYGADLPAVFIVSQVQVEQGQRRRSVHRNPARRRRQVRALLEIHARCRKQSGIPDAVRRLQRRHQVMRHRLVPFLVAAAVVLLDRFTKAAIKIHLGAYDTITVIPGWFNIVHTENPGIAFGMLANATGAWRNIVLIGFSAVVLIAISAMLLRPGSQRDSVLRTALAFILGGAFGNLYDRIVNGTVTDFVEVHAGQHYFPAFNVADSAITVGACLLLLDMWWAKERRVNHASEVNIDR